MKSILWRAIALAIAVIVANYCEHVQAASFAASDNATVQPGGPRSGSSGKAFFNVEGSNNGNFASYGVVDFNFAGNGLGPIVGVDNVTLDLTESNAGFSLAGPLSIYYTDQTSVNIQPGAGIAYQLGQNGAGSVGGAFGALTLLGSGMYDVTANGAVESFALSFVGDALAGFVNAINNGTTLRLVITPDAPGTAATYAGATNTTFGGPTLTFDTVAVPEPSTLGLGILGGVASTLVMGRRRRSAKSS
jgi:hypothetical protein